MIQTEITSNRINGEERIGMNGFYLFLITLLLSGCSFSTYSNPETEQLKRHMEKQVQNLKSAYTHLSTSRAQTTENANEKIVKGTH